MDSSLKVPYKYIELVFLKDLLSVHRVCLQLSISQPSLMYLSPVVLYYCLCRVQNLSWQTFMQLFLTIGIIRVGGEDCSTRDVHEVTLNPLNLHKWVRGVKIIFNLGEKITKLGEK